MEHGNRFAVHPPYWFVASMNPDEELEVRMAVSSDRGATFSTSHFPYKLSEKSYRVVDSKESSVFVQVMLPSHSSQTLMDRSEGTTFFKPHTSMSGICICTILLWRLQSSKPQNLSRRSRTRTGT